MPQQAPNGTAKLTVSFIQPHPSVRVLTTAAGYSAHNRRTPLYIKCTKGLEAGPKDASTPLASPPRCKEKKNYLSTAYLAQSPRTAKLVLGISRHVGVSSTRIPQERGGGGVRRINVGGVLAELILNLLLDIWETTPLVQ